MNKFTVKKIIVISLTLLVILISAMLYIYKCHVINKEQQNKVANIVFTTDQNYAKYTKVAILSAIKNKKKDSVYNINVLCVDIPESQCNSFKSFQSTNVNINVKPLSLDKISKIGNYPMDIYVSRADLFKFLMPELFPKLDKILYIDIDTVILGDLLQLYNTDIHNNYIAAVKKSDDKYQWQNKIGSYWIVKQVSTYNCGVLLFNLSKFRKDNITNKLIKSKNEDWQRVLMTQTAFNEVIPISKVKLVSPIYNTYSRWKQSNFRNDEFKKRYKPWLKDINSAFELRSKAVIIHFAGPDKPWSNQHIYGAKKWWYYAKMIDKNWQVEPVKNYKTF